MRTLVGRHASAKNRGNHYGGRGDAQSTLDFTIQKILHFTPQTQQPTARLLATAKIKSRQGNRPPGVKTSKPPLSGMRNPLGLFAPRRPRGKAGERKNERKKERRKKKVREKARKKERKTERQKDRKEERTRKERQEKDRKKDERREKRKI